MKPIICVTEFTEHTVEAVGAASAIARRLDARVTLVRSVDEREQFSAPTRTRLAREDRPRLGREATRLRGLGFDVDEQVLAGVPEEGVASFAHHVRARLVVLGCPPLTRLETWLLGCTAEQIATLIQIPLLLVRSAQPFLEWAEGRRQLRIFALVEPRTHSPAVVRALSDLREVADEAVEMHDRPANAPRHPRDAATHCAMQAKRAAADLVVVETRPKSMLPLWTHRTLAGWLLREAPMSILCVPDTSLVRAAERTKNRRLEVRAPADGIRAAGA